MRHALVLSTLGFVLCGCASLDAGAGGEKTAAAPAGKPNAPQAVAQAAEPAQESRTLERAGVLAPVDPAVVRVWPEAWSGEMLVLEVVEHGTRVEAGDVLVRLETRSYDEQLAAAERDMTSAEIRHAGLLEKNALAEQAATAGLEQASARLDRARRGLAGYLEQELAFSKRQDELMAQREQHNIDDQVDELAQVEKMYEADELVDGTEEIVLKRSRRDLDMTRDQVALSRQRRKYGDELSEPLQTEARKEDVAMQERALERQLRDLEVDRRSRADAESRSTAELEEKRAKLERLRADGALFTLTAPRSGVLLHGELDDYRPGAAPKRLERGSRLSPRSDVLLVADPARLAVALDVPESKIGRVHSGATARVRPLARPEPALEGVLELETWPEPKGGEEGVFAGTVKLKGAVPDGLLFGMHAKVELDLEPPPEG